MLILKTPFQIVLNYHGVTIYKQLGCFIYIDREYVAHVHTSLSSVIQALNEEVAHA